MSLVIGPPFFPLDSECQVGRLEDGPRASGNDTIDSKGIHNMANVVQRWLGVSVLSAVLVACGDDEGPTSTRDISCGDLDLTFLADGGVGRDGIPALTDPVFLGANGSPSIGYLQNDSRVIGVYVGDEALAIPHNVMYRHEIVNLNRGGEQIAVSYCPLTGSALAFDRAQVGGAEFGVSGLLFQANLIMYDRNDPNESLWPQMFGTARCGPRSGTALTRFPTYEMTWEAWRELHPTTLVIGIDPDDVSDYSRNPYGPAYENAGNGDYLGFPIPRQDTRRLPKERVLGLPDDGRGNALALPFRALQNLGDLHVEAFDYDGAPAVVFWETEASAAVALRPMLNGQSLTFRIEDGRIWDNETNTAWSVTGEGLFGPNAGERLEPIAESYVAFWLAWVAFNNNTLLVVE